MKNEHSLGCDSVFQCCVHWLLYHSLLASKGRIETYLRTFLVVSWEKTVLLCNDLRIYPFLGSAKVLRTFNCLTKKRNLA